MFFVWINKLTQVVLIYGNFKSTFLIPALFLKHHTFACSAFTCFIIRNLH